MWRDGTRALGKGAGGKITTATAVESESAKEDVHKQGKGQAVWYRSPCETRRRKGKREEGISGCNPNNVPYPSPLTVPSGYGGESTI